jgi:hypothetical protein
MKIFMKTTTMAQMSVDFHSPCLFTAFSPLPKMKRSTSGRNRKFLNIVVRNDIFTEQLLFPLIVFSAQ